jgi:hypothetical protein
MAATPEAATLKVVNVPRHRRLMLNPLEEIGRHASEPGVCCFFGCAGFKRVAYRTPPGSLIRHDPSATAQTTQHEVIACPLDFSSAAVDTDYRRISQLRSVRLRTHVSIIRQDTELRRLTNPVLSPHETEPQ